jgi:transposase
MEFYSTRKAEKKLSMSTNFQRSVSHSMSDLKKTGRGFIKILETMQFGLSFNIIRRVFSCFDQKKISVGFMNF